MSDLPLLPTTVIGSHAKPGWWHACKDLFDFGEWGEADLKELLDDAVDVAILDQQRAGVDIISDGESRRLDGYVDGYYAIIQGIEPSEPARKAGPWGYDQQTRYLATGHIEAPSGLGIVDEFEYLHAHTDRPTKATCAGPLTFASRIRPGDVYASTVEIAAEFAHVINEELKALVAAGADFIQIDEPARGTVTGQEMARLFNMATEGVDAKLAFHICFGNRFGQARFKRVYADYFPGAMEANAHQFVLEFASREMADDRDVEALERRPGARRGNHRREVVLPGDAGGRRPAPPHRAPERRRRQGVRQPGLRLRMVTALHRAGKARRDGRGHAHRPRRARRVGGQVCSVAERNAAQPAHSLA